MSVGERDGNAALRQATAAALQHKARHGHWDPLAHRWRVSRDVRVAILSLVPPPTALSVDATGERLLGYELDVDPLAPDWTIELLDDREREARRVNDGVQVYDRATGKRVPRDHG